jgi:hypothetical protein
MVLRFVVVLVASLAVASVAGAACLTCVGNGIGYEGQCVPSSNGRCSYTCCLWDEGTYCDTRERTFGCAEEGSVVIVPAAYFGTKLPMQIEGSALRLRLGKGQPVERTCAASFARQRRS